MTMKREVRDRWTAALRSGQYEQGKGSFLDYGGAYCCLGVLCDVTDREPTPGGGDDDYPFVSSLLGDGVVRELWQMNDFLGRSFPEIADWIEENVPVEDTEPASV